MGIRILNSGKKKKGKKKKDEVLVFNLVLVSIWAGGLVHNTHELSKTLTYLMGAEK